MIAATQPINLAHLDALSTTIKVDGTPMLATAIYADAPGYEPIGDPDEGIACIDDVARAAVVYLDEHARTGSTHALEQGRKALAFTLHMQEPDGRFVNFITDLAGTKNMTGPTSRPELGWWAFRGMWALARGYRAFQNVDPAFAGKLLEGYGRTEAALVGALDATRGETTTSRGRPVPAWLGRFSPDAASVAAIALAEMQQARPNPRTRAALTTVAEGVAASRVQRSTGGGAFDHAGHTIANPELWHAWGAHEGEALARAGQLLGRADLVDAAKQEAEGLLAWQLAAGRVHELTPGPLREGQQAYGVTMAVRGAMALHRATGDARYARMAGLHASWFAGNNMAQAPMYDPATGRGYDGIDAPPRDVNHSSGAESTVEALMSLQAIAGNTDAERMSQLLPVAPPRTWTQARAADLRGVDGAPAPQVLQLPSSGATGSPDVQLASLAPGSRSSIEVQVDEPGEYVLLGARMRDAAGAAGTTLSFTVGDRAFASLAPRSGADGPHVGLDRMAGDPIHLERGRHRIEIVATGPAGASPALVSSIVVHPAVARTELAGPGGRVELSWSMADGRLQIAE